MPAVYLDTSALGRVLLGEPEAPAVLRALERFDQRVASRLLRVELRRLALREDRLDDAGRLLAGVALMPLDDAVLNAAETVAPAPSPPSTPSTSPRRCDSRPPASWTPS